MTNLVPTRADVEVMRAHGWDIRDKFMFEFYITVDVRKATANDPLAQLPTLYCVELAERSFLDPGNRWVLAVRKVSDVGISNTRVLAEYPDPITCSVEVKLLGDGCIRKGIKELVRDKLSENKSRVD